MRSWRLSLVVATTVSLLASLSVAALAQEEEPLPITSVTGTVVEQFDHPGPSDLEEGPPDFVRGWAVSSESNGVIEQVIEWSDPRLPARHWMNLDLTFGFKAVPEPVAPEGALAVTTSNLLEGPEGSWQGTGRAIEDGEDRYSLYELTGDGAYEGLWAVLRGTPGLDTSGPWDHSYEGYIFEADPMAFPTPPAPVTTEGMQTFPEGPATVAPPDEVSGSEVTAVTGDRLTIAPMDGTAPRLPEDGFVRWPQALGTFSWSDPRLPTEMRSVMNVAAERVFTGAVLMEDPEGHWSGTWQAFIGDGPRIHGILRLSGYGAYDGLIAVLHGTDEPCHGCMHYDGIIVEGQLPPMPEPLTPVE